MVEHYLSYLTRRAYSNTNLRSWKLSEALKVYLWIIVHNVILIPEIYICKLYTNHTIVRIIRNWFFFFFILLVSIIWIRICFCCQKNINSELKGKKQALSQSGGKKKKELKAIKCQAVRLIRNREGFGFHTLCEALIVSGHITVWKMDWKALKSILHPTTASPQGNFDWISNTEHTPQEL